MSYEDAYKSLKLGVENELERAKRKDKRIRSTILQEELKAAADKVGIVDTPTQEEEDPPPPSNVLRISDYANRKTLGLYNQDDLDAWSRVYDEARRRGGKQKVELNVSGTMALAPVVIRDVTLDIEVPQGTQLLVKHAKGKNGTLLDGTFGTLTRLLIDDDAFSHEWNNQSVIAFRHWKQQAVSCTVRNARFLGYELDSPDGSVVLTDCRFEGTSPGGVFDRSPFGNVSFMGYHSTFRNRGSKLSKCFSTGSGLNGIFLSGMDERVEYCTLVENHRSLNPEGFGGGQMCIGGILSTIIGNIVGPSSQKGGGIELDCKEGPQGRGHTVEGNNKVFGHKGYKGIILQKGIHVVRGNDVYGNGIGIALERESRGSTIGPGQAHDNFEMDLYIAA